MRVCGRMLLSMLGHQLHIDQRRKATMQPLCILPQVEELKSTIDQALAGTSAHKGAQIHFQKVAVRKLLEQTTATGITPLMLAARANHATFVHTMLNVTAQMNALLNFERQTQRGCCALSAAAEEGALECVTLLVSYGANLENSDRVCVHCQILPRLLLPRLRSLLKSMHNK